MEENKIQYLQMIQNIIARMASNSFMLKGWTVTLVVGLLAFANVSEMESKFIILALIPSIMFWILDGFFIYQEKLFRDLYNYAIKLRNNDIDFSLNTKQFKEQNKRSWLKGIFSKTLWIFYLPVIIFIICALILF